MSSQEFPNGVTYAPYSIFGDLDLDNLEPYQESFKLKGRWYVLREAGKGAELAYRNAQFKNVQMVERESGERQLSGMGGNADAEVTLLSQCLFYGDSDGRLLLNPKREPDTRYLVPMASLLSWSPKITDPLIKRLKEISGIDQARTREQVEKEIEALQKELKRIDKEEGKERGEAQSPVPPRESGPPDSTTEPSGCAGN